ncbi:hypothetical protein Gpo141_00006272 [Globisporangium polare]
MNTAPRVFEMPSIASPLGSERRHESPASEPSAAPRRGLKRPALRPATGDRSHHGRKWAEHCGCSGPSCQAELFEDDECEELEFEVFEKRLKLHAPQHCASASGAHSVGLGRDYRPRRDSSVSSTTSSSQSDCESLDSEGSPPLLLHFLMMF